MVYWLSYPMVRFTLIWVLGLVCGFVIPVGINRVWVFVMVIALIWLVVGLLRSPVNLRWGILLALTFSLGFINAQEVWSLPTKDLWTADGYWGKVVKVTERDNDNCIVSFRLKGIVHNHRPRSVGGNFKVQAYGSFHTLQQGMILLVRGAPRKIKTPLNPGVFDYQSYMLGKGVVAQDWWQQEKLVVIDSATTPQFSFSRLRHQMIQRLESQISNTPGRQIVQAMVLGYREHMDQITSDTFAAAGTMHILVVSGLHLGILFALGLRLTHRMRQTVWGSYTATLTVTGVIWGYTLLTGMGVATTRAAIMFTILGFGTLSKRSGHSLNSLALAGLIILTIQPQALLSIGFQLSFSALLGIFLIQPRLLRYYKPRNWLMRYFWELSTVSVSAQLAVAPLLLFYFQQVSWYFLLGNVLTLPIATLVLVLGLLYFVTSGWGIPLLLEALHYLANLCFYLNNVIASLPGSTTNQLWITPFELVLCYLALISAILWLQQPRSFLKWAVRMVLMVWVFWCSHRLKLCMEESLIVYHLPKAIAVDYRSGFQTLSVEQGVSPEYQRYVLNPARGKLGARATLKKVSMLPNSGQLWCFNGKLVFLVNELSVNAALYQKCHYLIITNSQAEDLTQLLPQLKAETIILDGSTQAQNWRYWLQEINELKLETRIHVTALQGAFISDLNSDRATNHKY